MSFIKRTSLIGIILFILVIIQITNLKINFFPRNLILIPFFIGVIFLAIDIAKRKRINKYFLIELFLLFLPIFMLSISLIVNQYFDFAFVKEIFIYNMVSLISAYAIVKIYKNVDLLKSIIWLIGFGVVFQLIISFILFLMPGGFMVASNIFELTQDADQAINLNEFRMVGIGSAFFQSGILNSFVLVMLASLIVSKQSNNKEKNLAFGLMLIISLLGLFSSRSTIIGIAISFILILLNIYKTKTIFKTVLYLFLLTLFSLPLISKLSESSKFFDLLMFGTQFIFDFDNSQAAKSTGQLNEMWEIWPETIKTWIIGDAQYRDGSSYYMHTDVGYARFIFAVGIFGLISILISQIYMILKLNRDYFNSQMKIGFMALLFLCEIKGVTLFTPFLSLLFCASLFVSTKNQTI